MPIQTTAGGTMITGNAISLYRAITCKHAIALYLKTGMRPSRMVTPTAMRQIASEYTGKEYGKSRKGLETALADLTEFIDSAKAAQMAQS